MQKSLKKLSIQAINSTFIILYSFEQLITYMSRTIIFINTSLFHFSTPLCLLEVSLVMGCNISSNQMSKFILSSHSAPKAILLLHILIFNLRKCENHRLVLGYFYYKSADKSQMRKEQRMELPVSWVCAWVLMLTCLAVMLVSSTV